jgi:hypothetical protein
MQTGLEVSRDGGATYSAPVQFPLPVSGSFTRAGDTTTAFDSQGRLFWANLSNIVTPANPSGLIQVYVCQVNPKTGATIGTSVAVQPSSSFGDDKEWLIASGTDLYIAWVRYPPTNTQILLSRSTDHGVTWSTPTTVSASDFSEGFVWPATVTSLSDGSIAVAYHAEPGSTGPGTTSGEVRVARYSHDLSTLISKRVAILPGNAVVPTLLPNLSFYTLGCDQSTVLADPTRTGTLYVVAENQDVQNQQEEVVLAKSLDFGQTWSTSVLEEPPSGDAVFAQAAIDKYGDLVVTWYDDRAGLLDSSGSALLDVFAKYSTDGGQTWSADFRVNLSNHFATQSASRINDYFGVSLFGGTAYVAWNGNTFDSSGNVTGQQIWTNYFDLNGSLAITDDSLTSNNVVLQTYPLNSGFVEILENGAVKYSGDSFGLTNIFYFEGGANDTVGIEISDTPAPIAITDGSGTDAVNVGDASKSLTQVFGGNITVNGGTGRDTLTLFDQNDVNPDTYTITGSTIQRTNSAGMITYTLMNQTILNGGKGNMTYTIQGTSTFATTVNTGNGNDTISVQGNSGLLTVQGGKGKDTYNVQDTGANLTLNAGTGNDKINLGNGNNLQGILGAVTVTGQGGTDSLVANDQSDMNPQQYSVQSNLLALGLTASTVTYSGIATVLFNGSQGGSTYNIESTNFGTAYTVKGGKGNDTFNICPLSEYTHNLLGPVTVGGGGGTDALYYHDENNPVAADYLLLPTRLSQIASPGIIYSGLASVTVYGADNGVEDDFFVDASFPTSAGMPGLTVVGGNPNGGTGRNFLDAPNLNTNVYDVTGTNTGTLKTNVNAQNPDVAWSNMQSLDSGNGGLTIFKMEPAGSVPAVNGFGPPAGQGDWLDYSSYTTPVFVDLATGTATGIGGGASGAVLHIINVIGGNGGNTLIGDDNGNILIGGSGVDTIDGGSWRSLLIGGGASDHITGGSSTSTGGGDILIGGTTNYNSDTLTNMKALMAILAEWQSSDPYSTRFTDINTGAIPGGYKLNWGTTVHDDGVTNVLTGSAPGFDWFFASNQNTLINFQTGDHRNNT